MNVAWTQAAEGLPRRAFTVEDIRRMVEAGSGTFGVIDADERVTWVHTAPKGETWSSIVERGPTDTLTTPTLPGFSIRLADVG